MGDGGALMTMGRRLTHDEYVDRIAKKHEGRVEVLGTYSGGYVQIDHRCTLDGTIYTMTPNSASRGSGCPTCRSKLRSKQFKAQKDGVTAAFVGQTTQDGHLILEHVGYQKTNRAARYRYQCGRCGGIGETSGSNLKKPGEITGCGHCSKPKRESISTHLRNKEWSNALCQYYIATVDDDLLLKLGITKDYDRRATNGPDPDRWYTSPLYISQKYPRCWVWTAEQIILKETEHLRAPIPERWGEKWGGQSELRKFELNTDAVVMRFLELIEEISEEGFHAVYVKHTNKSKTPFTSCEASSSPA